MLGPALNPYLAALIAGPVIFLAGVLVHKLLVSCVTGMRGSALESEGHYAQLILTLGVALVLQNGGLFVFGSTPISIPTPLSSSAWPVGPLYGEAVEVFVNQGQAVSALIAVAVVAAFVLLMGRSRLGKSLRAAADNPEAAIYMGIDVERSHRLAFGFSVAITAIGSGLLVVDETFTPPLANATPLIQRVRSAKPDILLLLPTAISDAKLLLEKINEFGLGKGKLPTISNGAAILDPDLRSNMNVEQLEGVMSVVANWTTNAQKDFVAEVKKNTSEPWPTQHFVTTYGDMRIFKAALEAAGSTDRQAVAKALRAMDITGGPANFFPGNGKLKFDDNGHRDNASLLIVQWQQGIPIAVYPPKDAVAAPHWPKQ